MTKSETSWPRVYIGPDRPDLGLRPGTIFTDELPLAAREYADQHPDFIRLFVHYPELRKTRDTLMRQTSLLSSIFRKYIRH